MMLNSRSQNSSRLVALNQKEVVEKSAARKAVLRRRGQFQRRETIYLSRQFRLSNCPLLVPVVACLFLVDRLPRKSMSVMTVHLVIW